MARSPIARGVSLALVAFAFVCPLTAHASGYYESGAWGNCGNTPGLFDLVTGVALDAAGNVYVVDLDTDRVQKFANGGQFIAEWSLPGPGRMPLAIAVDGASVYVADGADNRIVKFTTDGTFVTQWGTAGSGDGQFQSPLGIGIGPDHSVYVSDLDNHRVEKFTPDGAYLTQWGGPAMFNAPRGIVTDPSGNVYVVDQYVARVNVFTSDGTFLTSWGYGELGMPFDIDRDADGNFYVTDDFY